MSLAFFFTEICLAYQKACQKGHAAAVAVVDGAVNAAAAPATVTALSAAVALSEATAKRVAEVSARVPLTCAKFLSSNAAVQAAAAAWVKDRAEYNATLAECAEVRRSAAAQQQKITHSTEAEAAAACPQTRPGSSNVSTSVVSCESVPLLWHFLSFYLFRFLIYINILAIYKLWSDCDDSS